MSGFTDQLDREIDILRKKLETVSGRTDDLTPVDAKRQLHYRDLPNGRFHISLGAGDGRFVTVKDGDFERQRLVEKIQDRRLADETERILRKDLKLLENVRNGYRDHDANNIRESLPKGFRGTPWLRGIKDVNFFGAGVSDEEWVRRNSQRNLRYEKGRDNPTSFGLWVRSKAEVDYAQELRARGAVFRYEPSLFLRDGNRKVEFFPDFEVRTDEDDSVLLEHFGRMGDPNYRKKCWYKLRVYQDNGFELGHNLYITTESKDRPADINDIKAAVDWALGKVHR